MAVLLAAAAWLPAFANSKPAPPSSAPAPAQAQVARQHRQAALSPPITAKGPEAGDAAHLAWENNGGGRVLSIRTTSKGYLVRMIKNGDVRIVSVPGQ